jgi:hypothetical protein
MSKGHCCYDVCGAIIHVDMSGGTQVIHAELINELIQANIYLANADGNQEFAEFVVSNKFIYQYTHWSLLFII